MPLLDAFAAFISGPFGALVGFIFMALLFMAAALRMIPFGAAMTMAAVWSLLMLSPHVLSFLFGLPRSPVSNASPLNSFDPGDFFFYIAWPATYALLCVLVFFVFFLVVERFVFVLSLLWSGIAQEALRYIKKDKTPSVVVGAPQADPLKLTAFLAACAKHERHPAVLETRNRIVTAFNGAMQAAGDDAGRLSALRKVALRIEEGPARALQRLPVTREPPPVVLQALSRAAKIAEETSDRLLDEEVREAETIARVYDQRLTHG